jgi:hypothetical protein
MTIKHNDIVKIEKLAQRDVYPIYGRPFNLKEGDLCQVLIVDSSDEIFPYFLRKDEEDFWLSSETELSIVENSKRNINQLKQDIIYLIGQLNELLSEIDD